MRTVLITPATYLPFELDVLKARQEIRVTTTDDDDNLMAAQVAAIEEYEDFTGHILRESTWDLYLDCFPDSGEIELPAPLQSVTSVTYTDTAGASQTLSASTYVVDTTSRIAGRVVLAYNQSWPSTYDQINAIRVRFVAGYSDPADIPQKKLDGLVAKIQEIYDGINRSAIYEGLWQADRAFTF